MNPTLDFTVRHIREKPTFRAPGRQLTPMTQFGQPSRRRPAWLVPHAATRQSNAEAQIREPIRRRRPSFPKSLVMDE